MDEASQFLQHIGITLTFSRDPSAHPYLMGAGVTDAYRVTLCNRQGLSGEVIALVDNHHRASTSNIQILAALGRVLEACPAEIATEAQWRKFLLAKDADSFDAHLMGSGDESDQHYLHDRFAYLVKTRDTLLALLDQADVALLAEFFVRYVLYDWPWTTENKETP